MRQVGERIPFTNATFRYPDGAWPNRLALGLTFLGWIGGIVLLTLRSWPLNAVGVLLTAQALVYSAYFIHECAHGALFTTARDNDRLGRALSWLNGACTLSYAGLKHKHMRHHVDRLDVVSVDYRKALLRWPAWARRMMLALEWAYVPAVEFLMRGLVLADVWREAPGRTAATLAARIAGFAVLGVISPKALALYALAYILFLHVLRFMDAFQHTYEVVAAEHADALVAARQYDRAYENENTYSNLVSVQQPWLNLLTLNFAYHNAHHAKPAAPWHQLPTLHQRLYGRDERQVLPCRTLFATYHRNRVKRVLSEDYGLVAPAGDRAADFLGAVGVSFLTAV